MRGDVFEFGIHKAPVSFGVVDEVVAWVRGHRGSGRELTTVFFVERHCARRGRRVVGKTGRGGEREGRGRSKSRRAEEEEEEEERLVVEGRP